MAKREFLLLAHDFNSKKHSLGGKYVSEKLDGTRAFWDGGVSRDMLARDVPYANVAKDGRYKSDIYATGLWSRYGKVIHAPNWWLDKIPKGIMLDGELWMGRGKFQLCRSTVSTLDPGPNWRDVRFHCFGIPKPSVVFGPGEINNSNFKKTFDSSVLSWYDSKCELPNHTGNITFEQEYLGLQQLLENNELIVAHTQAKLSMVESRAEEMANEYLYNICTGGGEGLIVREPWMTWIPERSHHILKIKQMLDAEATVVGYTTGRETDKGSRLLGMMGALIVEFNGHRLELSGFTDAEREFGDQGYRAWAASNPGVDCPDWITNPHFPIGSTVTFKYRELSDTGIPKEARYWRK